MSTPSHFPPTEPVPATGAAPEAPAVLAPARREPALRLIIVMKLVKAIFVLGVALVFTGMLISGSSVHLHGMATNVRQHVTAAWSIFLANAVVSVTERRHLAVATAALYFDGVTTSVEWYALSRGHAWGEWLVVGATSSLLPFEVVELVRHGHVGRFIILVVNLAVVLYLARHAWKRHVAHRAAAQTISKGDASGASHA